MANNYIQIYIHLVFAVKNRENLISPLHEKDIHAYMGGILKNYGHVPICIGGTDNHVHILFGYNVNHLIPDLISQLKSGTSRLIHENHWTPFKFEWQRGYGAFSFHHNQVPTLIEYVQNQHLHHKGLTLEEETKNMLDRLKIQYDCRYIFHDPE